MANAVYPLWKQALLKGTTPDLSDAATPIKVVLVDLALYTYSAAHSVLTDIAAGARTAISPALANKTVSTAGVFDADDVTLPAVTGPTSEAIVLFWDTGTDATSLLIAFLDTGVTNLPVIPNGGDLLLAFSGSGILAI